jgi:hypothetical protein
MGLINYLAEKAPFIHKFMMKQSRKFPGTADYWERRYSTGGSSGAGSYNNLAHFKAEVLNAFVKENNLKRVVEFGCGDGNQLALVPYPEYIGLDISKTAIEICIEKFASDSSKSFFLYNSFAFNDKHNLFRSDLALSLDVIYHIIEDDLFTKYIEDLFSSSIKYVIIYSNDFDDRSSIHVRERKFTTFVENHFKDWELLNVIKNKYPYKPDDPDNTSSANFYFYKKVK